eukprot:m.195681 g.195681  ORF g.195681 m.195681 type:complete len:362 (+) comp19573_c0_seq1:233-1318(+)
MSNETKAASAQSPSRSSSRQRSPSVWSDRPFEATRYNVLAAEPCEGLAQRLERSNPTRFAYRKTSWKKFGDSGMDNIELGGFTPKNRIRKSHVLFIASFHNNDSIMSQFQALVCLCESFVESLTILLPYYPVGTMERVMKEGVVATANTVAVMLSSLPHVGRPIRIMIYDIHTLQNRFYFSGHAIADTVSTIPLLLRYIQAYDEFRVDDDGTPEINPACAFDAVAFPDEGAKKRFGGFFPKFPLIICGKIRDGDARVVNIQEGDANGKRVLIVDDMVRSGGTICEAAKAMKAAGATHVTAFCTHAAGRLSDLEKFYKGNSKSGIFDQFIVTNTNPTVTSQLPTDDVFHVLDILPQLIEDLD